MPTAHASAALQPTPSLAGVDALRTQSFLSITEHAPVCVVATSMTNGEIYYANQAARQCFNNGVSPVGQKSLEFYEDPADRALLLQELQAKGSLNGHPLRVRQSNDDCVDYLLWLTPTVIDGRATLLTYFINATDNELGALWLEAQKSDLDELHKALQRGCPLTHIEHLVQRCKLEPAERQLRRLAATAQSISKRVGKGPILVHYEHNRVRLDAQQWQDFWSALCHPLLNAIDHGLETNAERRAGNKPHHGIVTLSTALQRNQLTIQLTDDGRGINWDLVRTRAQKAGLPSATQPDLHAALFAGDGLASTPQQKSGRGAGMHELRQATERLNGHIEVDSCSGRGTTLRFVFPEAPASY